MDKYFDTVEDPRRRWLIQALGAGAVAGGSLGQAHAQGFSIFGSRPAKLPPTQSIYGLAGEVRVNNQQANLQTRIKPGDTVETGKNSEVIFVVNTHSMILRGDSKLVIDGSDAAGAVGAVISGLRMLTGKLLSVSRNSPMRVSTNTSTIGIRGTGFYVEAEPDLTYFCTCYGATDVQANNDPDSKESIAASRHDKPIYIAADGAPGRKIRNAPFLNHTDQELSLIETLVGRRVPYVFGGSGYSAPRRTY
ncbi:MAG: hypothetical protein RLZZ126_829 [Pseudomonadota bacterium]|jgi:hypothetical protein